MKILHAVPYLILAAGTAVPIAFSPLKPATSTPPATPSASAVTETASAKGMDGDVVVSVTADDNYIYSVEVTEQNETQGIGTIAVDKLPSDIVSYQSYAVDSISGATVTSDAIKEAVASAVAAAGITNEKYAEAPTEKPTLTSDGEYTADIVIVGAGGAGMTAATVAADAGESVILVEAESMVGGNSIRATGGMNAAKTEWQDENEFTEGDGVEATLASAAENYADNDTITELAAEVSSQYAEYQKNPTGYFDSVELMELDTMIGGKGINNPSLVETLCTGSADGISWLETVGGELHSVGAFGGASVKRIHRPVDSDGKTIAVGSYVVPVLEKALTDRDNVRIIYNMTADQILMDKDGTASGIHAVGKDGEELTVHSKAVVLATGGFGANFDKIAEYRPDLVDFMTTNASGSQGQGIDMGTAVGADTVDMDQIQIHPTVEYNSAHLITEGLRGDGAILVNSEGKRFYDEVSTRDKVSAAEISQPGQYAWLIMDQKMVDASKVIEGYISAGYTKQGDDYRTLAAEIGVDPDTFEETMNSWNECVKNGSDPDFGRTSFTEPLDTAPYYAIKVTPGIHHTMGGLVIDSDTEVLDTEGTAIPGLFAAGEVTGGVHGANRLGGNAVADFIVFGRIAGENAAEYAESRS